MNYNENEMRLPEEGTPTGAGPGTGMNASDQRPRESRRLGRGNPEIQSTVQRSRTTPRSPLAESAVLNTEELTQAGLPRRRIKWTYDMNVSVMKAFFRATRDEVETLHYRQQMRNLFLLDYPNLTHITQQNLSDRKRAIERRNLIPPTIMEQLRREINSELTQQPAHNRRTPSTSETPANAIHQEEINNNRVSDPIVAAPQNPNQSNENVDIHTEEFTTSVFNIFNMAKAQFMGMNSELRPFHPKPKINRRTFVIMNILNTTILPPEVIENTQYHQINDLLYCSAYTIVTIQNSHEKKIRRNNNTETKNFKQRSGSKPQWQIRLEKKIEGIRKDLGYLTSYRDNRVSSRKRSRYDVIKKRHIIHSRHEPRNENVTQLIDTIKQKLNAAVYKYRRHTKSYNRKSHNFLLIEQQ